MEGSGQPRCEDPAVCFRITRLVNLFLESGRFISARAGKSCLYKVKTHNRHRLKLAVLRGLGYDNLPTRALNYVWANQHPPGEVHPSPYTDQIMVMPVHSGSAQEGQWVRERRNVRADYREAFGEAPPPVAGVALMTDTDHTADSTQALYGDIVFRPERSAPETTNPAPGTIPSGEGP